MKQELNELRSKHTSEIRSLATTVNTMDMRLGEKSQGGKKNSEEGLDLTQAESLSFIGIARQLEDIKKEMSVNKQQAYEELKKRELSIIANMK